MAATHQPPEPTVSRASSPTAAQPPNQRSPPRRALPDRDVDATSIEDAYVAFILYCNPAVPADTDATALREAFRTPPKSGGKSFSTYTLFELIKQLETKKLKTWAELALKLGVDPPDQEKGQSSQKIQQYAVRLKRWMHSMHVDAFFEYLIGRPSPYWTEIPPEHIPVAELERDGVAAEDDMALRALLPQIKPRRGRKKPEDEEPGKSPPQRPSPQRDEAGGGRPANTSEPWTAQPDGRGSVFLFPPVPDPSRLHPSAPSWGNDVAQTPMSAYPVPQSAITPSSRNAFWADEPKSAITPSKPKSASRRHGAKVVSSAWRSGGLGAGGKTRGRPPINRGGNAEGPFSAFPTSDGPVFRFPSPTPDKRPAPDSSATTPTSHPSATTSAAVAPGGTSPAGPQAPPPQPKQNTSILSPIQESAASRPAKRRMLSLQVPERKGGEVRLATPPLPEPATPPAVMVNGQAPEPHQSQTTSRPPEANQTSTTVSGGPISGASGVDSAATSAAASWRQPIFSPASTDRTNVAEVEALFVSKLLEAEWYDANQSRIPPCGLDEALAISQTVVENLLLAAPSKEAFLINLSGLVGGGLLMPKNCLRVTRLEELPDRTQYSTSWELRFGSIAGTWTMEETVPHAKWKKREQDEGAAPGSATRNGAAGSEAEDWERKYKEVAAMLRQRDEELMRLKSKIVESVRKS
ncbi:hypothetical protein MYCTH_2311393 [Thermothelomyces thermophilus ATCC 42464]|uniref:ARS binding protein 2 n=1 Tax=Thermothelomyces thermophilus (strain ATCC 42464 / BCRC 31852 / DSM 1799) TaxID=573729 RepID=G2QP20_THET4|nr:uncharacterized protein MYCTH_2311393 [Thermothelomyces thermophilus ATCC 42464]AEO61341.1 hypothetical protein MYCTH_2311393 [Thermothelomyces thermophilus ATCC 42464]